MSNPFSERELQNVWNEMASEKFKDRQLEKQEIMNAIKLDSQSTIVELKKGLKYKLQYTTVFIVFFFVFTLMEIFLYESNTGFLYYLALTMANILFFFFIRSRHKQMDSEYSMNGSMLVTLKENLRVIKSTISLERFWGIIAILFISIYGINQFVENSSTSKSLIIKISIYLILIVGLGFIAEYFTQKKFGTRIKKLEENIIRLETLK
jgi:hypothetical protein